MPVDLYLPSCACGVVLVEFCVSSCACRVLCVEWCACRLCRRFLLSELYLAKMKDSTAIFARCVMCKVVRVLVVELCLAQNDGQYCDFYKICELHGLCGLCLCGLCLSNCALQK